MDTLVLFEQFELAEKVAVWTINNMQDKSGYFYYRKGRIIKNKVPTFHWGQATMYLALSSLLSTQGVGG